MSNTDKLTDFAIGKLNALFDTVSHAMPVVSKYVLQVTQMGCLVNILTGAACLVLLVPSVWLLIYCIKGVMKFSEYDVAYFLASLFLGTLSVGLLVATLVQLLDFWQWVCLIHPDLYLIHQVLQKVTQ